MARTGEEIGACKVYVVDLKERDHLKTLGVDGKLTLNSTFNR